MGNTCWASMMKLHFLEWRRMLRMLAKTGPNRAMESQSQHIWLIYKIYFWEEGAGRDEKGGSLWKKIPKM